MTDILKIDVKDENLRQIFNKNPFYIDIKGSINICQIRCGQTFQNNNVNIASMTNVGKVLILNPDINEKVNASIKLAFDTSNSNVDDEGNSQYELKNIFFTTPSFHRINGELSDFESYIVYASTQENGNILFSVICTLYNGVSNIPTDNHELLTYKLFDELFLNNNTIPQKFGTKPIEVPQNIDISELMPQKGNQSFYEYVNPNNPNVNIRIYQKKLNISNNALEKLKAVLTPGALNNDLKLTISQQINPNDGLFFFFSKDLTNNYKNFMKENVNKKISEKDTFTELEEKNNTEEEIEDEDFLSQIENDQTTQQKEKFTSDDEITMEDLKNNKIYEINSDNGLTTNTYNSLEDLKSKNEDYDENEILNAVNKFPYKTYKNSLWRLDYKLIVKKNDNEEVTVYSIDDVIFYMNKESKNNKISINDIWKAFKKNIKINKYKIEFKYSIDKTNSTFDNIISSIALWVVLLILFIFYQIIYYALNINYQKIDLDNNDILVQKNMENLAAYRTWINLIFIFQIIFISIFSLTSISGVNMSNKKVNTLITLFSFLFILPLFIFIYKYSKLRSTFNNPVISYIESISIPLFFNDLKDKDKDNSITFSKLKSFLFSPFSKSNIQNGGNGGNTSPPPPLSPEPQAQNNKQSEQQINGKPFYPNLNSNSINDDIESNIFKQTEDLKNSFISNDINKQNMNTILYLFLGFACFLIILFCIFLKIDIRNKGVILFVILSSIFVCIPLYMLYYIFIRKYMTSSDTKTPVTSEQDILLFTNEQKNKGEESLIFTNDSNKQGEESLIFTNDSNKQGEESLIFTNEQKNQGNQNKQSEESLLFTNEQKNQIDQNKQSEESLLFTNKQTNQDVHNISVGQEQKSEFNPPIMMSHQGGLLEILKEINEKLNTVGGKVQNAGIKKKELRNYIEILEQFENSGLLNKEEKLNISQLLNTLNKNIIINKKK